MWPFGRSDKLRRSILDDVSAMIEQLRQEQWTSNNNSLSQSRSELDKLESALSQLAQAGDDLRADLKDTENRLDKNHSKQLQESIQSLRNELTSNAGETQELRSSVDGLTEAIAALRLEHDGLATMREESADFRKGIANEVSSLRQIQENFSATITNDLAILRQQYGNFSNGTTNELAVLREQNTALNLADEAARQDLANSHNESVNSCEGLRQSLESLKGEMLLRLRMERMELSLTKHWMLRQRMPLTGSSGQIARNVEKGSCAAKAKGKSLEECFGELDALVPKASKLWRKMLNVNSEDYKGLPTDSCSVKGHPMAELFRYFLGPYLTGGTVLDIGCGPQPIPSYLEGYPIELIAGIDPLLPESKHPFQFAQGVAEFLPWDNDAFNMVIAATSLDHVLLPDRVFEEIDRVLRPDGRFIIWTSFVEGAEKYDPYSVDIKPVDKYHIFHFEKEWFEELLSKHFHIEEAVHMEFPGTGSFYSCASCQDNSDLSEKGN